jgi:hypothetical protein
MAVKCLTVLVSSLFLAATLFGQQQTDWTNASNNADVQYRSQVFERTKACYLEFRDQKQATGNTTFDAGVDYKLAEADPGSEPTKKSDHEHIVTTPGHTANSRIADCSLIMEVTVSNLQRH